MITIERFTELAEEVTCELPEELFSELNLGVSVLDETRQHPQSVRDDLFVMGEYRRSSMGKGIVIFYGSFARVFADFSEEALKNEIRKTIRHEFRHHWEGLSGERGLEVQDEMDLADYLGMNDE